MKNHKLPLLLFAFLMATFFTSCAQEQEAEAKAKGPKNVILFIGDGMGFNQVDATSLYLYGRTGQLTFEGDDWVKAASATYPAILSLDPEPVYAGGYNPGKAWEEKPNYILNGYTDSGASGTALSTGMKTYYGSIGIGPDGDTLQHITSLVKDIGKAAGVISSVQIAHATPASFVANNEHRNNYEQIARQMLLKSRLDVIMGAGHPLFDDDGQTASKEDYRYVGGEGLWLQLSENTGKTSFRLDDKDYVLADSNGDGQPDPWTLVSDSTRISELAGGNNLPARLLGIPQVRSTLQQSRSGERFEQPWEKARVPGVPSLEQMTRAAVNVLNQNPNGFFLMVEGGAIDWAGHDNHAGRMIEEMNDFLNAINNAIEWVETNSSWDETLLIVTSDHETGMLSGPDGENPAYGPETTNEPGTLPPLSWHSDGHSNSLVPFYAKGKGSEIYVRLADEHDPVRGRFFNNTDVPKGLFLLWE